MSFKTLITYNSAWEAIKGHYNEHKVGSIFLRREFKEKGFLIARTKRYENGDTHYSKEELRMSIIDQYTLILRRAGYLQDLQKGAYKKVKRIPKDLKVTEAIRAAWPKKPKAGAR
jgi:hypothetical protein